MVAVLVVVAEIAVQVQLVEEAEGVVQVLAVAVAVVLSFVVVPLQAVVVALVVLRIQWNYCWIPPYPSTNPIEFHVFKPYSPSESFLSFCKKKGVK